MIPHISSLFIDPKYNNLEIAMGLGYTGTHGTYIEVQPDTESEHLFNQMVSDFGWEPPELPFHCTIIHTMDVAENPLQIDEDRVYPGKVDEIVWWVGSNEKGYVVCLIDSPELRKRHKEWKALGLETKFREYRAHVTLKKGIEDSPELQDQLKNYTKYYQGMSVQFDNESIADVEEGD